MATKFQRQLGEIAFYAGQEFARDAASFKQAVEHDLDRIGFRPHLQDPFDPVMRPVWQLRKFETNPGKAMMIIGTGMLLTPDVFVAAGGLYFGGPAGAVGAVALWNITGAGLLFAGYMIS